MLCLSVRANGNAISRNFAVFLEKCVSLRQIVLRDGANASAEITFQGGKTDGKALASHFDIAFAQSPKAAERFVGIGGKHHSRVFVAREEAIGNAHGFVRLCRAFDIDTAFRV